MSTETVRALDHLGAKEMALVRHKSATRYTGKGESVGGSLALVPDDLEKDQLGAVHVFLPLVADVPPTAPGRGSFSPYEARIFDAQIGGLWFKLSAAANALAKNVRGQKTVDVSVDEHDIIVRSTSVWRAFGFVLDTPQHRLWGWTRKSYVIEPVHLDFVIGRGELQLVSDSDVWEAADLVTHLRTRLRP